jgi:hypothetical protein
MELPSDVRLTQNDRCKNEKYMKKRDGKKKEVKKTEK